MALTIKNKLVKEDILDENGNKLGELKFNPNDSRIMKIMSSIIQDCKKAIKKINEYEKIKKPKDNLETLEDFEEASEYFEAYDKATDIEMDIVDKMINDLSEIFGKDTVELFTQGTKDAESLLPIIEFIEPYIKETRQSKVKKYMDNKNDVME